MPEQSHGVLSPADLTRLADAVAERVAERLASRPQLVDRVELSTMLGLGVATIERRTKAGDIPHIKVGRRVLYRPDAVITAMEQATTGGDR